MNVQVVSAVIVYGGRILLTQRRADDYMPLLWECPGGKVDGNESNHGALRRELFEELGFVAIAIPEHALAVAEYLAARDSLNEHDYYINLYLIHCGSLLPFTPREGQGIGWFTEDAFRSLDLTPSVDRSCEKIVRAMRASKVTER